MLSWVKAWLHEPLVHFLCIGALIFVVDQAVRSDADSPRVIVIDAGVRDDLVTLFETSRGRKPTAEEYDALVDGWLYDEVMYREAVALGLDKGDDMFRSRLELKLRAMLINNVALDPPTDADLRTWFEANRDRYTAPRRFDFVQFQIDGEEPERTAAELAAGMREGTNNGVIPAAYENRARFYLNRSRDNIAAVFGEDFAAALLDGPEHTWRAVPSAAGWHVARVRAEKPAIDPDFESLKPRLAAEWRSFHSKRLAREAFQEIRDRYEVRREDTP